VAVKTTPGNAADGWQLPELVDGRAGEVTADQAYDREANHAPWPVWGWPRASAGGGPGRGGRAFPDGGGPRSRASLPKARTVTAWPGPAIGAWPR
jgi:hypothetical protein